MLIPSLQNLKYGIIYICSGQASKFHLHQASDLLHSLVNPLGIEWVENYDTPETVIAARRFNVGNIGQYATVSLTIGDTYYSGDIIEALHKFVEVLMDVSDNREGDISLNARDYGYNYITASRSSAPQDHTRVESSHKPKLWKRLKKQLQDWVEDDDDVLYDTMPQVTAPIARVGRDMLQEDEDHELERMEHERKLALDRIKRDIVNYIAQYHDDPKDLMAELLRGKVIVGQPGRLLVNGDLKIVLPEFDEMEIRMPAMCRTLYILFLKQRKQGDGIILKNMDEYRDEILNIYGLVKPGASHLRVKQSVDNLCDPFSESLNQTISRINRCIRNVITEKQLAQQYIISGVRGDQYSIALDPESIELPRALQ